MFWTNYFYNCEKVRREYLERVQSSSLISTLSCPSEEVLSEVEVPSLETRESEAPKVDESNVSRTSSQNSLVPAEDSSSQAADNTQDDAESYIQVNRAGIASPPCSIMSVEDLVLVNKSVSAADK